MFLIFLLSGFLYGAMAASNGGAPTATSQSRTLEQVMNELEQKWDEYDALENKSDKSQFLQTKKESYRTLYKEALSLFKQLPQPLSIGQSYSITNILNNLIKIKDYDLSFDYINSVVFSYILISKKKENSYYFDHLVSSILTENSLEIAMRQINGYLERLNDTTLKEVAYKKIFYHAIEIKDERLMLDMLDKGVELNLNDAFKFYYENGHFEEALAFFKTNKQKFRYADQQYGYFIEHLIKKNVDPSPYVEASYAFLDSSYTLSSIFERNGLYEKACEIHDQYNNSNGIASLLENLLKDLKASDNINRFKALFQKYYRKYENLLNPAGTMFYKRLYELKEFEFINFVVEHVIKDRISKSPLDDMDLLENGVQERVWNNFIEQIPPYNEKILFLRDLTTKNHIRPHILDKLWLTRLKSERIKTFLENVDFISDKTIVNILDAKGSISEADAQMIKAHSERLSRIFAIYEEHRAYGASPEGMPILENIVRQGRMLLNGLKRGDDFYTNKIKPFGQELEKNPKIIKALLTESLDDQKFSYLWGMYFTLRYFQKDLALSAVRGYAAIFKKGLEPNKGRLGLDDETIDNFCTHFNLLVPQIEGEISSLFTEGYFKERSDRYKERTWGGFSPLSEFHNYTKRSDSKILFADIPMNKITVYYNQDISIPPQDIIIETYGGNSKTSCTLPSQFTIHPISETMMSIGIELGDCELTIFQGDQLKPEHFEQTHALLLKRMSDFIKRVKTKYPTSKIYVKGSSFGGFFATSYALLSSIGISSPFYKEWASTALQKQFGAEPVTPIDGALTHANGIDYIAEITETDALKQIKVPVLVHQNYDDERVPLSTHLKFFKQIPVEYLYFSLSRLGALPFMGDGELSNIRGHNLNDQALQEFNEAILHFMDMVHGQKFGPNRSEFSKLQTLRRLKLANPELESPQSFTKKDVEQFLSNLRYMEISGKRSIDGALELVNVPKSKESYDRLMDYVSSKGLFRTSAKRALMRDRITRIHTARMHAERASPAQ